MQEPNRHTDEEVMAGFQAGQQDAFTQVYTRFQQRVYWFARKYLAESADAQDVTSDTFIQLWQHRHEFDTLNAVSAFLHVTVRNKCYDLLRRQQMKANRHLELLHLLEQQEEGAFHLEQVRIELMQRIYAEVEKLPARMKEIFLLSYQQGLKPAEIADRLQLKVQTVTNQRVSAIKILKLALAREPLLLAMLFLLEHEGHFMA